MKHFLPSFLHSTKIENPLHIYSVAFSVHGVNNLILEIHIMMENTYRQISHNKITNISL